MSPTDRTYVTTPIREAYEHGGVLLIDEVDSGNANLLTYLNMLLSNGEMTFPDRKVKKHENFVCIATANTYGRGADLQYVGRNRLDSAFLDRFFTVFIDYSDKLEKSLVCDYILKIGKELRSYANQKKIKVIISTRSLVQISNIFTKEGENKKREYLFDLFDERVFRGDASLEPLRTRLGEVIG